MALSTTDLSTGGGSGLPKTIQTGNHVLRINKITLEDYQFIDNAKHLVLHVETQPIDGFEGFMIDKDDESKGHFAGQIGRVKASQYAFADGETKSGVKIQRDRSLLIFLQNLCKSLGVSEWFVAQDDKHDTIEDFIKAFAKDAPFTDKYMEFCIAGKEYESKSGYTNYDMWLPKGEGNKYAYGEIEGGKVLKYDEAKHLKKLEVKNVKSFGNDNDFSVPSRTSSDFNLDD
tara:strand:+ start:3872 stop:4561 length:690 start_codon:yes stop_codon:yes gene_type:complete